MKKLLIVVALIAVSAGTANAAKWSKAGETIICGKNNYDLMKEINHLQSKESSTLVIKSIGGNVCAVLKRT